MLEGLRGGGLEWAQIQPPAALTKGSKIKQISKNKQMYPSASPE